MKSVVNFIHIDNPYNFSIILYESHNSFKVPAISYSPDILLMLFLASDSRVIYFSGGKFTILSMLFEDIDSFYTLANVLSTLVSNLSMGGVYMNKVIRGRQV